jgi:hypothetical protein
MSFMENISYEETPEGFSRTDLTPYREVFDSLKPGLTATIVVPTGPMNDKNRGELELSHERAFRKVAQERNSGLRVGHNHMPNGQTRLRLMPDKKRTFTEEAARKRDYALLKGRVNKKVKALMVENPTWTEQVAQKHYLENNKEIAEKLRSLSKPSAAK